MARQFVSPRTILSRMSLVDEAHRLAGAYQDPNYLPFYFHVGRVFEPRRIFCVGAEIGLQTACLIQGCSSPAAAVCIQPPSPSFYSPRVAVSNVRSCAGKSFPVSVRVCSLDDESVDEFRAQRFDACLVTVALPCDTMMDSLDLCWGLLSEGGILCVDRLDDPRRESVFRDFCRARNLEFRFFRTRYSAAIAEK